MARTVVDVRAALLALAGAHPRDPRSLPVALTDLEPGERLRVAVIADPPGGTTHPEIQQAVRRAADILSDAGHDVVDATPPGYEQTIDYWAALLLADIVVQRALLDAVMGPDAKIILDHFEASAPPATLELSAHVQMERHRLQIEWSAFFADHPVIISPTWGQPAFEHGADLVDTESVLRNTLRPALPANFLALPGAIVPCGTADGLPVGVQVMGDRFTDLRCLAIAQQVQDAVGAPAPIDPVV